MSPPPFVTEDGDQLPWLGLRAEQFLDRTTVIYGPSKSGKSVAMKAIMKLLSAIIGQVMLISPSENQNRDYEGIVPKICTHSRIWLPEPKEPEPPVGGAAGPKKRGRPAKKKPADKEGGLRFFHKLFKRQEASVAIYNRINRLNVLRRLFNRIAGNREKSGLKRIEEHLQKCLRNIKRRFHGGQRDKEEREILEKFDEIRRAFFKRHIILNIKKFGSMRDLDKNELFSIERIEFNPRMLLILDDCASELTKKIVESQVFKQLFYRGRHAMITVLIACHSPTDLATGLRKNTFNCLFTAADSANAYFGSATNGFTPAQRKEVLPLVSAVFEATDHEYLKFAYVRDSIEKFFVFKVEYPRTFRFGDDALWEMEEEGAMAGDEENVDNEFYQYYVDEGGD
jgi:hypothetical protein